ncbi:MAG: hypothetical protein IJP38_09000 [Oscillospiraceae bacterium]|nr:hypothetical protein [Oscillospiraceae bacterium]MBQ9986429.1 hypothetical protein [Oscillospiraceae bacterium]
MCKKFLSIILTAVMVLSLLPAAGAVTYPDGEAPQSYEYVFNYLAHGLTASESLWKNQASGNIADGYDVWGYIGRRTNTETIGYSRNLTANDNHIRWSFDMSSAGYATQTEATANAVYPEFNPDSTDNFPVFMLEIKVEKGGAFFPVLEYAPQASSAIVEVFLIKNETGKSYSDDALESFLRNADPATRLGVVDLCSKAGDATEHRFPSVELDDNSTYYLAFVANGINKNASPEWHKTAKCIYSENHLTGFRLDAVATGAAATYNFTWEAWGLSTNTNFNQLTTTLNSDKSDTYAYEKYNYRNALAIAENYLNFNYTAEQRNTNTSNNVVTYPYVAIKISVPHAGKYSVGLNGKNVYNSRGTYGADAKIYVLPASGTFAKDLCTDQNYIGEYHFYNTTNPNKSTTDRDTETLKNTFDADVAGDYWLVIELRDDMGAKTAAESVFGNAEGATGGVKNYSAWIRSISITNLGLTDAELAKAPQSVDPKNAASNDVTLGNESAEIKVLTSTVAENEGTIVSELCKNAAVGSAQSITAPAIDENREFLYWTSGIGTDRKIVCETEKYDFTAQKGVTYLTAVYRDMTSDYVSVIFLNGNGELISRSDATYKEGNTVTIEALPTLTGFGTASGWQLAGTENVYTADSTVTATGKAMVFVAQYENEETSIDITVNGGTMVVENKKEKPAYGDNVTVTAPSREDGSGYNVFAYWTKTVNGGAAQIVSLEKEYSFSAWENCTLTAVYTERQIEPLAESVRKILLGTMNGNVNIAEFIGCEDAIERGIVYGEGTPTIDSWSNKISMATDKNALSVINNSGKNARAYAIFEGGVIYSE